MPSDFSVERRPGWRGIPSRLLPSVGADRHLHVDRHVQAFEDREQPINGEAVELDVADAREVSGRDAGEAFGLASVDSLNVQGFDDLGLMATVVVAKAFRDVSLVGTLYEFLDMYESANGHQPLSTG